MTAHLHAHVGPRLTFSERQLPAYPLSAPPKTSHVSKEPRFLLKQQRWFLETKAWTDGCPACSGARAWPGPAAMSPGHQRCHLGVLLPRPEGGSSFPGGVGAWFESIRAFCCKLCPILSCLITFPRVAVMSYTDGAAQSRRNLFSHSLEAECPLGLRGRVLRPRHLLGAVAAAHQPPLRLHPPVFSVSVSKFPSSYEGHQGQYGSS